MYCPFPIPQIRFGPKFNRINGPTDIAPASLIWVTGEFYALHFNGSLTVLLTGTAQAELVTSKISENIYALIGPLSQRSADNLANNANFGVIITREGVVLIDTGGSFKGAKQIHAAIKKITDKPVTHVINSGGQDHRWIANAYWQKLGAKSSLLKLRMKITRIEVRCK